MPHVVVMLSNASALPQPKQPGFLVGQDFVKGADFLSSKHEISSTNEMSLTLFGARLRYFDYNFRSIVDI